MSSARLPGAGWLLAAAVLAGSVALILASQGLSPPIYLERIRALLAG